MTVVRLLFICTHNACRSVLCEAIARRLGGDRLAAASAGSAPAGRVHPMTLTALGAHGYAVHGLSSKSIAAAEAFAPDVVVTVCDSAAAEVCPLWLEDTPVVHWGLPDPSRAQGGKGAQLAAFDAVIHEIERRIKSLLAKPLESLNSGQVAAAMEQIGSTANGVV